VFGDVQVADADEVVTNWEQIKAQEKGGASLVDGVTDGLPALIAVQKLMRKANSVKLGIDTSSVGVDPADERKLGAALASLAAAAMAAGVDAESALAGWNRRFKLQFQAMERLAAELRVNLADAELDEVRRLWVMAADEPS